MVITSFCQNCGGISAIVLAFGATWSMISGAVVKGSVAGANFSVNEKLQQIENVANDLEQTTFQLRQEPGVSRLKLRAIERDLAQAKDEIDITESHIEHDLEELVDQTEM